MPRRSCSMKRMSLDWTVIPLRDFEHPFTWENPVLKIHLYFPPFLFHFGGLAEYILHFSFG